MKNIKKIWALTLVFALFVSMFSRFDLSVVMADGIGYTPPDETADSSAIVTDGIVYDTATYGTTTYLGGSFSYIGPNVGYGAPVTVSTSAVAGTYPKVNGTINTVVPDGSGGWYIGGNFTAVGGTSVTNLAHIYSTGVFDEYFLPEPNYAVTTLLLDGTNLYVGGNFTSIGGQYYSYLASIDVNTGLANTWDAQVDSTVNDMALDGSTLYIVGAFTNAGGQYRSKAAALDVGTALATSWNPFVQGTVYTIVLDATYAYLGGSFYSISSTSVNNLASYSLAGSLSSWRPEPTSSVSDLILDGTTLYAAGAFTTIDSASRNSLAALDTGTGSVTSWDPSVTGGSTPAVNDILLSGSTLYFGGSFTTVGTSTRYNVAAVDTSSAAVTDFDPSAGGTVNALALNGTAASIYVGGGFKSLGSTTKKKGGLAAINNGTNAILSFEANISGGSAYVNELELSSDGGTLYAGGSFTSIDGVSREDLAAIDTATGDVSTGFDAAISTYSYVYALQLDGSTLYVGGNFSSAGGQTRSNIAALSATTGTATSWDPNITGGFGAYVYDFALSGSTLYVGGNFTTVGSDSRNHLAAIDTSTGLATSWDPALGGMAYSTYVYSVALSGSTLYVGGRFSSVGSDSRANLAAIDTSTGLATSWAPDPDGTVQSVSLSSSNLYIGGDFANAGGEVRAKAASISLSTGTATTWDPAPNNTVYLVNVSTGHLYVGGSFSNFATVPRFSLAHYTLASNSAPAVSISSATPTTDGSGTVDIAAVLSDSDSDDTVQLKVEYKAGTDCSTAGSDPTLDETDANTTATYGDPKVENDDTYQVGNASGYITTSSGSNTVNFDWSSMTDLPSVDSTVYCLRLTPYDGTDAGTVATTTLTIDNVVNVPASVSLAAASTSQVNVTWGANSNPTGTEYYAENTTAGTNSGWTTNLSWSNSGLSCGTSYSYRVKARNQGDVETDYVSGSSISTLACADGGPAVSVFSGSFSSSDEEVTSSEDVVTEDVGEDTDTTSQDETTTSNDETTVVDIVKEFIDQGVSESAVDDNGDNAFADAKKIESALSVVKDTITNNERVNYDILIEDEQVFEVASDVQDDVSAEVTQLELEQNWPAANDEFLSEDAQVVQEALDLIADESADVDLSKLSDAERIVEDKVDEQVRDKLTELLDSAAQESFEWQVGDRKIVIDRDTRIYVTLDNEKAKKMQELAEKRGENKLIIGPSTTIGESSVSAVILAMAGAPLDDPDAGDKYFFGGLDGLKKKEVVVPDKPKFTNDLKGRTIGKGVLFWLGAPKKAERLTLFAVDKVDPKNKKTWKVYRVGRVTVDEGNKAVFNLDLEDDLPVDFSKGKKKMYFVVQDKDGNGSVVDVEVDFSQQFDLDGVKLSKDLVSIKDPMGEPLPDGIKDPMGFNPDNFYTSVLTEAAAVNGRDLAGEQANVKYMTGYALPGSTVVVTWQSLTYSSVVIADASEGYFEVEVPDVLESGDHEALVYVYNNKENLVSSITSLLFGKGRSES